jgi:hypothetical protein
VTTSVSADLPRVISLSEATQVRSGLLQSALKSIDDQLRKAAATVGAFLWAQVNEVDGHRLDIKDANLIVAAFNQQNTGFKAEVNYHEDRDASKSGYYVWVHP